MKKFLFITAIICFAYAAGATPYDTGIKIAKQALIKNQVRLSPNGPVVITTGGHQYHHIWARDFANSVQGMLLTGHEREVKETLELFFNFQDKKGFLPRLLDDRNYILRAFFGGWFRLTLPLHAHLKPNYITEHGVVVIDSNLLLSWAAWEYIAFTHDLEFAKKYFDFSIQSLHAVESIYLENHLLAHQAPFSDWEDSIAKSGTLSSTQFTYILSMKSLEAWANLLGKTEIATQLAEKQEPTRTALESKLWDPIRHVYLPMLGDYTHYSIASNILPIAQGLIPQARAQEILAAFETTPIHFPLSGRANYPTYPKSMKNKFVRMAGTSGYHDEALWVQVAAWTATAYRVVGKTEKCEQILGSFSNLFEKFGNVYEVYEVDRKVLRRGYSIESKTVSMDDVIPLNRFFYKSESPFTWGAASYLEAAISGCN